MINPVLTTVSALLPRRLPKRHKKIYIDQTTDTKRQQNDRTLYILLDFYQSQLAGTPWKKKLTKTNVTPRNVMYFCSCCCWLFSDHHQSERASTHNHDSTSCSWYIPAIYFVHDGDDDDDDKLITANKSCLSVQYNTQTSTHVVTTSCLWLYW